MAYSLAFSQAIAITLYIRIKTEEGKYDYLSTKALSEYLNIPVPTAAKVLKSLNTAGLIETKEGAGGGIMLARKPADITLLDIFTAIEHERPLFKSRFEINDDTESVVQLIGKIEHTLTDAEQAMKKSLSKVTLANLLKGN